MKSALFTCDQCGAQKKESNHWFIGVRYPGNNAYMIRMWDTKLLLSGVMVTSLIPEEHLCGLGCATKAMCAALESK